MGKIISFENLQAIKRKYRGKRIVHCHGVFDLLHYGHLLHLQSAKKHGDMLVVTVTPDRFVNKGPGRPRFSEQKRAAMLVALGIVDYVAINKYPRATEAILALQPDFYAKGPDYKEQQKDITGGITEEGAAVDSVGGKIVFTDDHTESATELINEYLSHWDSEQQEAIAKVKKTMSLDSVLDAVNSLERLKVFVVGEPIIDTYVFCQPEALSSKSPTVSANYLYQEDYAGGSLAIANHLSALGCKVDLLITHGGETYFKKILKKSLSSNVKLHECVTKEVPTPRKTRFLTPFRAQRIFELMHLRADQWEKSDPQPFRKAITTHAKSKDVILVADFGHGMFEGSVLDILGKVRSFMATNVQTNSGNFGFNPFTKQRKYDYLSIDERELRIATHDRFTPVIKLADGTVRKVVKKPTSITLATAGSIYYDKNGKSHRCPAFFKEVIDTTGAGDAYFAITSLLVKMGLPGQVVPFIGNCYAGLKTRILGNKSAVSKVDLVRTIQAILK